MKNSLSGIAQKILPQRPSRPKQDYITKNTEKLIQQRRQIKNDNTISAEERKQINATVKKALNEDKSNTYYEQ